MNPVLQAIGQRVSGHKLNAPAPTKHELENLFQACLRVPDHKQLRPWRFLCIENEGLQQLGKVFAAMHQQKHPQATLEELENKAAKAQRAPMIIVGICCYQPHEKVPELEQQLSTGCVLHNLGLGLRSMGYASIWRTGDVAFSPDMNKALGLAENESIIGFLYVGTAEGRDKNPRELDVSQHLADWP